jgi:hypothetical protein
MVMRSSISSGMCLRKFFGPSLQQTAPRRNGTIVSAQETPRHRDDAGGAPREPQR